MSEQERTTRLLSLSTQTVGIDGVLSGEYFQSDYFQNDYFQIGTFFVSANAETEARPLNHERVTKKL